MNYKSIPLSLALIMAFTVQTLAQTKSLTYQSRPPSSPFGYTSQDSGRSPTTGTINPQFECKVNREGFEICDFYIIWCPNPDEECIEVH